MSTHSEESSSSPDVALCTSSSAGCGVGKAVASLCADDGMRSGVQSGAGEDASDWGAATADLAAMDKRQDGACACPCSGAACVAPCRFVCSCDRSASPDLPVPSASAMLCQSAPDVGFRSDTSWVKCARSVAVQLSLGSLLPPCAGSLECRRKATANRSASLERSEPNASGAKRRRLRIGTCRSVHQYEWVDRVFVLRCRARTPCCCMYHANRLSAARSDSPALSRATGTRKVPSCPSTRKKRCS